MANKPASEDIPTRYSGVTQSHFTQQIGRPFQPSDQAGPSRYHSPPPPNLPPLADGQYTLPPASVQQHDARLRPRNVYNPASRWMNLGVTETLRVNQAASGQFDFEDGRGSLVIKADAHRSYDSQLLPLGGSIGRVCAAKLTEGHVYGTNSLEFIPDALPVSTVSPEPEPLRARIACSFCRTRKLKCDGASPCRHCERRDMECTYAVTNMRARSSAMKNGPKAPLATTTVPSDRSTPKKRNRFEITRTTDAKRPRDRGEASQLRAEPADCNAEANLDLVLPSSRRAFGSDLAMITHDTSSIPMQPDFSGRDGWWQDVFTILGATRQVGNKLVRHLLTCFVQSNAIFFGLLHAPTLLNSIASHDGYSKADPALYLSVLAVSACDMHRNYVADERTADMRATSEEARKLSTKLSELALTFLQASTTDERGFTPAVGQAASILALVQPDGSSAQEDLINLAENVVRKLKLHDSITSREPLMQDYEPDSDFYWSRPVASDSPESEVKYESIVRLCWTGLSHRFRRLIALPDEDINCSNLPEFILQIRPMAFWQPSLLPDNLPPPFFHSQDLMRRSAHLSRLMISLAQLEQLKEVDNQNGHGADTLAEVNKILASLDGLEAAFVRHRPQTEVERRNVLGRTLQMFCRMHVWVRLTIWRKFHLWSSPQTRHNGEDGFAPKHSSIPLPFQDFHPTVDYWLGIMDESSARAQEDLDSHAIGQTVLQTTVSDLDSLIRHTLCALDIIEASGLLVKVLPTVTAALSILKRFASVSQTRKDLPQFDEQMIAKMKLAADGSNRLQSDKQMQQEPRGHDHVLHR